MKKNIILIDDSIRVKPSNYKPINKQYYGE